MRHRAAIHRSLKRLPLSVTAISEFDSCDEKCATKRSVMQPLLRLGDEWTKLGHAAEQICMYRILRSPCLNFNNMKWKFL